MKTRKRVVTLLIAASFVSVDCGTSPPPIGTGTITVSMTDAPFPIDAVQSISMWIVRVDAKVNGASDQDVADVASPTGADPTRQWVTIAQPNAAIDIVPLHAGATVTLGSGLLPARTYQSFRLVLDTDKSQVVLKGGTVLTGTSTPGISWPSAGQSGVKIVLAQPFQVVANAVTPLIIDFNLDQSFVVQGTGITTGGLLFRPTIVTKP